VAQVRIGHAVRYGAMTYNDKGEVAGGVVLMLKGANASQVVTDVKERIEKIKKTLPEGIIIEPFYDRTKMVDSAIHTVTKNLIEGALIVIFVLVLFLGNMRAGLIVASVIPLSMMFAIIMMNIVGVSGNLMSLGALDFGLIVDGAVIIVEAVLHRLSGKHGIATDRITPEQLNTEVENSAGKMMNAAVFGQIIILIVYLPVLSLTGIEGKMFRPMAQTVSFALIGAFLLSLTYVPMMSSLMLSRKISHADSWADKIMLRIQKLYKPLLQKSLAFPKTVMIMAVALLGISIFIITRLGGEFIPELDEGDFAVDARLMSGSSLTETINTTQKAVAILRQRFPEVEKIVTRIGASEIPTDPMPPEMTDIMISLKPKGEWTTAETFDELADKMSKALSEIPGMTAGFQFPVQMRFNELISGAKQDVVCKIFGDDMDSLASYAHIAGAIAAKVNGARDIYVETVTGLPQIVVNYKREAMAHHQLNIADVNQLIRAAFAGEKAGIIYEKERRYDLVVRLEESSRKSINDVSQLLIPTPSGLQIPLYQVADITVKEGLNQVQREDAQRRIIIGFNVRGRDVESVVNELTGKIEKQLKLPAGYHVKYGGQFENLIVAKQRLSIAVPAALLLILLMLYFAFGSVRQGMLIFSAIPLSAIGGILALWLRGMPFSISAGVGFIALFGVAVLNGIVLISEFNRLKRQGMTDINQIIMEGTQIRLRPVLMTAAVASLGFLPMALSRSAGAEVQRPLATVVIGGLITATLLTLIILPVLYKRFEKIKPQKGSKIAAVLTGLVLLSNIAGAQQSLTLDQMLKLADTQNLELSALQKGSVYWKELQSGIFDPPKTQLGGEYGGINSTQNDTRFFVGQSFSLPAVYQRQKQLYKTQEIQQQELASWKQAELHRNVKEVFYQMVDLEERRKLLERLDSIYSRFQQSATLRLQAGESNTLEKTTADAQLQQLQLQQQALQADLEILQKRMQWLLHTEEPVTPLYTAAIIADITPADTALPGEEHPQVRYAKQQEKTAEAQTLMEKAKLSPDFTVGYNNQSIIGYQSSDGINQKYYDAGHRFHFVNLSVGIPLFNSAAKARIRAGKINEEVAKINTRAAGAYIKSNLAQIADEYKKHQQMVRYYEQSGMQQAELIIKNAKLSFEHGEISYLEWTMLMNSAVNIQLGYLDAAKQFNQTAITLAYLNNK